jgi:hypothetical protein
MTDSWTEDPTTGEKFERDPAVEEASVSVHAPEVRRDITRREQLRREELEHLTELRDRVQAGIDGGGVDLVSGAEMLLNISKARMMLGGVGMYPF